MNPNILDCTLRDGGYYTKWDFAPELVEDYLQAMAASRIDYVELGLRGSRVSGFAGAHAYTTDAYLRSLALPAGLNIGVMVNAADLLARGPGGTAAVAQLFSPSEDSPVALVRIACHAHEVADVLPAASALKTLGYMVGVNLMQIAGKSDDEISALAGLVDADSVDVLYFADSMGSLEPERVIDIVSNLRAGWNGAMGIHTHDNMGRALANTVAAFEAGVAWLDCTVTGMGRGPGNAATEYVVLEFESQRAQAGNHLQLFEVIRKHFRALKIKHQWGINPYYYLAGKYGIHPTFVQEMLGDARFQESEVLSVINHLKGSGASKFTQEALRTGREYYSTPADGGWQPSSKIAGREVLILGAGPSLRQHRKAVEAYIDQVQPVVMALNVEQVIDAARTDLRIACHPLRLLADWERYRTLNTPLVLPLSQQSSQFRSELEATDCFDVGLQVKAGCFEFHDRMVVAPSTLVAAYALAVAASGKASRITMAGFDGFHANDPRQLEMDEILTLFQSAAPEISIRSILPTRYELSIESVYGLVQ